MRLRPFSDGDVHSTFQTLLDRVCKDIDGLDHDYVLKASPTELEQYFISKASIEPLILHTNEAYIENQSGTQVDVSHDISRIVRRGERALVQGTQLDIALPFEGNPQLWRIQPSTYTLSGYPEIEIRNDCIKLTVTFPDDAVNAEELKQHMNSQIESLARTVSILQSDVANHNASVPAIIKAAFERKRQWAFAVTSAVAGLGILLKRRETPLTYTLPIQRRPVSIRRPSVPPGKYAPEPELDEADYQHILDVIRSMGLVIERNPQAFASLDEESIRTHILLQLNGHYDGSATGETFNAAGKTDILIRVENRNAFIAECKFWNGPQSFTAAIDQLLSYLSWRDSKYALLIFNKNKNTRAVRQKMHEIMTQRPEYQKTVAYDPDGDSRYIFVKESDPGREIVITTQLFDIPTG